MNKSMLIMVVLLLTPGVRAMAQETSAQEAFGLSYAAEAKKDIPNAIKPLKAIEPKESGNYLLQIRMGWLLYLSGLYNESMDYYKKAAQLEPKAVEPLLGMVGPLAGAGKNDEIVRVYQNILVLDPFNYTALSRMAWITYSKKEYSKAEEMYRMLVERYPSDTEMLLGLAYCVKLEGRKDEAAKYLERVLQLSPKNARALAGLK